MLTPRPLWNTTCARCPCRTRRYLLESIIIPLITSNYVTKSRWSIWMSKGVGVGWPRLIITTQARSVKSSHISRLNLLFGAAIIIKDIFGLWVALNSVAGNTKWSLKVKKWKRIYESGILTWRVKNNNKCCNSSKIWYLLCEKIQRIEYQIFCWFPPQKTLF